jgi:enamine deaminase RidA (YjgF/YER057c/UK114 family)
MQHEPNSRVTAASRPKRTSAASPVRRSGRTKGGSSVVEHAGILYFGGVVADDVTLDMEGQTKQITHKLDALLAEHSSHKTLILSALVCITDIRAKPAMNKVWNAWIGEQNLPARATLGITGNEEGGLIEVVITSAKSRGRGWAPENLARP